MCGEGQQQEEVTERLSYVVFSLTIGLLWILFKGG